MEDMCAIAVDGDSVSDLRVDIATLMAALIEHQNGKPLLHRLIGEYRTV